MTEKKFEYVPFVTEVMIALHPKLSEPDTKGEYADGKYKTEATADEAYTKTFKEMIEKIANSHFARKPNVHLPWKQTKDGAIAFNFKSPKKKPVLLDSKNNELPAGIVIRSGSLIRIAGVIAAWEKGSKRGISLWPDVVRVIRLKEAFDPFRCFGPAEHGYDAESGLNETPSGQITDDVVEGTALK